MKHFTKIITFLLIQFPIVVHSQLVVEWEKSTAVSPFGRGSLLTDSENNVYMVRENNPNGMGDYAIQKYTPSGDLLWEINNDNLEDGLNVNVFDWCIDADDNLILVGDERSTANSFAQSYILKIDSEGTILWQSPNIFTNWVNRYYSVVVTDGGDIVVYGTIFSAEINTISPAYIHYNSEGEIVNTQYITTDVVSLEIYNNRIYAVSSDMLSEIDVDGNTIWSEELPSELDENIGYLGGLAHRIFFVEDEMRIVSELYSDSQGSVIRVFSYTVDGDLLWSQNINVAPNHDPMDAYIYLSDATIDAAGNTYFTGIIDGGSGGEQHLTNDTPMTDLTEDRSGGSSEYHIVFVAAVNSLGEEKWIAEIPDSTSSQNLEPTAILYSNNQTIVVSKGMFEGEVWESQNVRGFHADNGQYLWNQHQSASEDFESLFPAYAIVSNDNSIYISGYGSFSTTGGAEYLYLHKYHINPPNAIDEYSEQPIVGAWPNPTSDNLHISTSEYPCQVQVYNSHGQLMDATQLTRSKSTISVADYPDGVYTIQVKDALGHCSTTRFVHL